MKQAASLHRRLVALVLGVVTLVWLGIAATTWVDAQHELDELLDGHLAQGAAILIARQTHEVEDDDVLAEAPSLHRYAPRVAFQVWHKGALILRSANAPPHALAARTSGFETRSIGDASWRIFAARGAEHDVQVYVGEQLASRNDILWAVLRSALWPMAIALPLLALAVWWSVQRGLQPLHRLRDTLARRQPDALDPLSLDNAPRELVGPVAALNSLFGRIDALIQAERRFTADAAHELRTPIAAIRTQAQVALGASTDVARLRALGATIAGCDRAAHLIDQLLTLSRLEQGTSPALGPIDLAALARRVVTDLAGDALRKQQQIAFEAEGAYTIDGDDALLAVLVRNLVDNAIRYSPADAAIRVAVGICDGAIELTVEDAGPGMSEEQLAHLGQRFYRVLGSGEVGSGLGWSIVQRIAAVHGASFEVGRSASLGGLASTIRWPA